MKYLWTFKDQPGNTTAFQLVLECTYPFVIDKGVSLENIQDTKT